MESTTKNPGKLDLVAHVCNPGTQKVEEGGPGIQNQLEIQSKPEASLSYILFSFKKKSVVRGTCCEINNQRTLMVEEEKQVQPQPPAFSFSLTTF